MQQNFLNKQQLDAVMDTEGAVLVFAGAGSGKTRVLTHRVAHLIEDKNVNPWNVLAITFTNKATSEMKIRLNDMLGENEVWVSTFHSLCAKILFFNADKIGYSQNFSIYDESATKRALQRVLREKKLEEDKDKKYAYHIGNAKNLGLNSEEYGSYLLSSPIKNDERKAICEVYERYDDVLKENNAMDFDDLLIKCKLLFEKCPDVLEYYQRRFRYIHVDEFQDTNGVQFDLIKLLAGEHGNVFVVGDDDQSIYGWRGANVNNILDFDKAFPDVKIHKLEENYRSTQPILDCANKLIKNNATRSEKSLYTEKKDGVRVEYLFNPTEYAEVDKVLSTISSLKKQGYGNSDFAILVRNNALTRLFEINMNKSGINYKVFGGFKFFDRKEILDVIAYMRLIVNPSDGDAVERIINFPKRGIGDASVEQLKAFAATNKISLYDAVSRVFEINELNTGAKGKINAFYNLIEELTYESGNMKLVDFAGFLVEKVGFSRAYMTGKEDDENRFENIKEFLVHIEENFGGDDVDISEFLHSVTLDNSVEEDFNSEYVTLATMHSVKGLEFKVVFIVACEDGIIPSRMSFSEKNGVDEERRVMYVAITRAMERLYISCVNGVRNKYGSVERTVPSRFISETKGEQLKPVTLAEDYFDRRPNAKYLDDYSDAIPKNAQMKNIGNYAGNNITEQPKTIYNKDTKGFAAGAKVQHKKYGLGTVLTVEGSGAGTTATIAFQGLGIKKFALQNAPLTLV